MLKIKLVKLRLPRLSFNDYFSRGTVSSHICRGSLGMGALSRRASTGIYCRRPYEGCAALGVRGTSEYPKQKDFSFKNAPQ